MYSTFKVGPVRGNCVTSLNVVSDKFAHVKIAINRKDKDGNEKASFVTLMWRGEKAVEKAKKMNIEKGQMLQAFGELEIDQVTKDGKNYTNVNLTVNPYDTDRVHFPPKEDAGSTDFNPNEYK